MAKKSKSKSSKAAQGLPKQAKAQSVAPAKKKSTAPSNPATQPKKVAIVTQGPKAKPGPATKTGGPQAGPKPSGGATCTALENHQNASEASGAVRLARNIVLLEFLAPVPRNSVQNTLRGRFEDERPDPRRTLSFQHESDIVTTLAFLSGISDDSEHVTAVCLEELSTGGCKVLVAINKLKPTSSSEVLDRVQRGFTRIFSQLAEIGPTSSKRTRVAAREDVFNTIVALSQNRIVTRLGLRKQTNPYGGKSKQFIGLRLEDFLQTQWQKKVKSVHPEMTKRVLKNYRLRSEALLSELYDIKSKDELRHDDLANLIRHIVHYLAEVPLRALLDCLPVQDMNSDAQERLFSCLSKVARYWESAKFLCRQAKRFQVLNQVTVESVYLLGESFKRPAATFAGTVQSVLSNLSNKGTLSGFQGLPEWAQKVTGWASPGIFAGAVNKRIRESKIHAEIQILAHYENASPDVLQPRVIASSKDACYLCNACIRLHGKHSVPKSHGKLYPGWRLPGTQRFDPLRQKLNAFLEQEIRATLQELSRTNTKPVVKFANESSIFPLHISASTLTALSNTSRLDLLSQVLPASTTDHEAVDPRQEQTATKRHEPSQAEGVSEQRSDTPRGKADGATSLVDAMGTEDIAADHSDAETVRRGEDTQHRPGNETTEHSAARPGEHRSALSSSADGQDGWFCYRNMEVFLESSSSELVPEWLSRECSAEVLRDKPNRVFDVLSLPVGTDSPPLSKGPDGRMFFSFGDRVVVIDTSGRTKRKG